LIRLRQAVNHPYLVIHSDTKPIGDFTMNHSSSEAETAVDWSKESCDLCQEPLENNNPTASTCGHTFCRSCIMDYVETMKSENPQATLKCPDCNQLLTLIFDQDVLNRHRQQQRNANHSNSIWDTSKKRRKSILDKINLDLFQTSTKMEALMEVSSFSSNFFVEFILLFVRLGII
jgi:DNA repair protein RAD16